MREIETMWLELTDQNAAAVAVDFGNIVYMNSLEKGRLYRAVVDRRT